jgi:hypothetical protein
VAARLSRAAFRFQPTLVVSAISVRAVSIALLLPVLAALGFIAMGKELVANTDAAAAVREYLSPDNAVQRLAIRAWKDNLLNWYFSIIGAASSRAKSAT